MTPPKLAPPWLLQIVQSGNTTGGNGVTFYTESYVNFET